MNKNNLRQYATGLLAGFALQFLAGMVLNLFVTIPQNHPGVDAANYFGGGVRGLGWALADRGGWVLSFHVYLAALLVVGSIGFVMHAALQRDKYCSIIGTVTALFTIGAFFNGVSFINYNHDASSLIMATCWLVAVGTLVVGLIKIRKVSK